MAARLTKVMVDDRITIATENKKKLAKRFGVSIQAVNSALRGASKHGNAPMIRETAMNDYPYFVTRK